MLTRQKTVGIRVPDSPICLALLQTLGNPVLNTSAQVKDEDAWLRSAFDVDEHFGRLVDLIVDGGELAPEPSTVVSLLDDSPEILRQGKGDTALL